MNVDGFVSTLIGAGSSLVGSAQQAATNREMYDYNNWYNSPAEQIKRLRAAGINPAKALSSSLEVSPGNSSSPPDSPDYAASLQAGAQFGLLNAQAELAKAQARNVNQDTKKKEAETEQILTDNQFREAMNQGQLDLLTKENQAKLKDMDLTDAQIQLVHGEYEKLAHELDEIDAHRDEMIANANKMNEEAALAHLRQELETRLADSEIAKNNAAINELATAAYANVKRGDLDSAAFDYQRIVNKYAPKSEQLKIQGQKIGNIRSRVEALRGIAAGKQQVLDVQRTESGQGVATFPVIAGMREYFGAVGAVFGGTGSKAIEAGLK